jgi:2-succinyl-6-hydroxy-2,4-cyclohexadiene-1-carboxylate synthase
MCLDHGGEQVRRGGAGCGRDGDRAAGRLCDSEGHETSRALVENGHRGQPVLRRKCQRDRGVARAGARDGVGHPAADELVHESLDRRKGGVDRDHLRVPEVVFLPGFMQHADTWSPIAAAVGERYPVRVVEFEAWTFEERLAEIRGDDRIVVGYSMGGRLALHAALRGHFAGLVVVGASGGIADPDERRRRIAADLELADWIETHSIEEVVARWERNPVFASQSPEVVKAQRAGRLDHDPVLLARLLRSAGQGALDPIWDRLGSLEMPVLALAGENDSTYRAAAERIAELVPQGSSGVIAGAGHAAHLEAPDAVCDAILAFVTQSS